MGVIAFTAFCAAGFCQVPAREEIGSYLYDSCYCEDSVLRGEARPYKLQPGDIMFAADTSVFWTFTHHLAGTSHPTHSGIVFKRCDGTMAILEAGPDDTMHVRTLDALPHLRTYENEGRVWIRARTVPLTEEQSDCLARFAMAKDGKRFAIIRLGGQLTPLRSRGPIRTVVMGKYHGDQRTYFCSELVTTSLIVCGLIDERTARPSATYPRDLFMDHSPNLYLNKHLKLAPCWDPPARWTSDPQMCQKARR